MCEKDEKYLYWLLNVPGIGAKKAERFIAKYGSAEAVYKGGDTLVEGVDFISQRDKVAFRAAFTQNVEEKYKGLQDKKIEFLPIYNAKYPERLRNIPDPPYALYIKGTIPKEQRPSVAVIGARECTTYGLYVAKELGERLAMEGIQVISGLARGIDSEAQKAAVLAGGDVYAILGCGVDICYPKGNFELYEKMAMQGGVLSEYVPGTEPKASLFPPRNRIISGLADVVVVVEAKEKSGTLITVDMALEQGKEVYVIPGRVTDPLSAGCNRLMKQGAGVLHRLDEFVEDVWTIFRRKSIVMNDLPAKKRMASGHAGKENIIEENKVEENITEETKKRNGQRRTQSSGLGTMADKIVDLLNIKPQTMQQLYSQLNDFDKFTIAELSELLFEMENLYILHKKDMLYFLNIKKV